MTTAIAVSSVLVQNIPLEQLEASRSNPRRTMDEEGLEELAASIREHGVNVPLLVRPIDLDCMSGEPLPGKAMVGDAFEIVCGHRRSEAATIAGLTEVPCIVRDLSDQEAAEIGLVDNLQRVDVPAVEEAEAFGALLTRLGSIAAVAARVGKDHAYVAKRLRLCSLTAWSQEALREGLITVDHALLLARLADGEQNDALRWCLDHAAGSKKPVEKVIAEIVERNRERAARLADHPEEYSYYRHLVYEPQSVARLKAHISEESGIPLSRAPWPLDETLPESVACAGCANNTTANAPLFGDLDIAEPKCANGACFHEKTAAFVRIQARCEARKTAQKAGQPPVPGAFELFRVSWKPSSKAPRMDKSGSLVAQVFLAGQWVEAEKRCPSTRTAITVDWSDAGERGHMGRGGELRKPGEIVEVCVDPKCKTHRKAYSAERQPGAQQKPGESWQEREKREKKEIDAFRLTEEPVRRALYDAIAQKIGSDEIKRVAMEEADSFAISTANGFASDDWRKRQKYVSDLVAKSSGRDLDLLLFASSRGRELHPRHGDIASKDKGRGELRRLAKLAGADAAAIERAAEKAAQPKAEAQPSKKAEKEAPKKAASKPAKTKSVLSPATKKRIADAAKKRWANNKRGGAA